MTELITIIVFLGYSIAREWLNYQHIRDLETKLMAKTPDEYVKIKRADNPLKSKPIIDESEDYIDPLDADPNDALKGLLNG